MTVSNVNVLVVDDSAAQRALAVNALQAEGFEVTEARSGLEAIGALKGQSFSLIITDVNMPHMNGLEVVRFVRDLDRQKQTTTPVIIISTDGRERDRERGMSLGANAYLIKPVAPEVLVATARKHLAQSSGKTEH